MRTTPVERKLAYMLRAAVIDAQHVEKLKNYKLDMWTFCKKDGSVCYMCLGGARAILGMGASTDINETGHWPEYVRVVANALDYMRVGNFRGAAGVLGERGGLRMSRSAHAKDIVDLGYRNHTGRASWEDYLRAACVLLGQKDPGASA